MEKIINELPSPLTILMDPLSIYVLAAYLLILLCEEIFPARKLPKVKFWRIKGLTFFTAFFFVASYLPMITDPFLAEYQLFDISHWGLFPSLFLGTFVYELVTYAYHYAMHRFGFLWRTFHQVHHSAERLDAYGALFHSPLDMIGFTLVGSVSFTFLIGLSPTSISAILFTINFLAFFQHANINTPRWLGYLIQRPESHSIHHGRGIHNYNFADFPVVDIIFGTIKNPSKYQDLTGFYDGASNRIKDMLLFKDVSAQPKE